MVAAWVVAVTVTETMVAPTITAGPTREADHPATTTAGVEETTTTWMQEGCHLLADNRTRDRRPERETSGKEVIVIAAGSE